LTVNSTQEKSPPYCTKTKLWREYLEDKTPKEWRKSV